MTCVSQQEVRSPLTSFNQIKIHRQVKYTFSTWLMQEKEAYLNRNRINFTNRKRNRQIDRYTNKYKED